MSATQEGLIFRGSITAALEAVRAKKSRRHFKPNPVVSTSIQLVGNGQKLAGALAAVAGPMNDGSAAGQIVASKPASTLHGFESSQEALEIFNFVAHKRSPDYRNRFALQLSKMEAA